MSKRTQKIQELAKKNEAKRRNKAIAHTRLAEKKQASAVQAQPSQPSKADKKAAQKAAWAEQLEQMTGVKFDPVTVKPVQQQPRS